jgi:hypothetical protein
MEVKISTYYLWNNKRARRCTLAHLPLSGYFYIDSWFMFIKCIRACLEVWLWLFFKVFFTQTSMPIMFFYFLKIIFKINTLKWFENIKNILIQNKKKFKIFKNAKHPLTFSLKGGVRCKIKRMKGELLEKYITITKVIFNDVKVNF